MTLEEFIDKQKLQKGVAAALDKAVVQQHIAALVQVQTLSTVLHQAVYLPNWLAVTLEPLLQSVSVPTADHVLACKSCTACTTSFTPFTPDA